MAASQTNSRASAISITSLIQYALFAIVAYILAGAPFLDELSGLIQSLNPSSPDPSSRAKKSPFGDRGANSQGGHHAQTFQQLDNLMIPDPDLDCKKVEKESEYEGYKTYVLRRDPLVVYVEGFLGEREREEVLRVR